jgi:hypothetical protein
MPPELLRSRADGGWGIIDFLLRLDPSVALRPLNVEVSTGDYLKIDHFFASIAPRG